MFFDSGKSVFVYHNFFHSHLLCESFPPSVLILCVLFFSWRKTPAAVMKASLTTMTCPMALTSHGQELHPMERVSRAWSGMGCPLTGCPGNRDAGFQGKGPSGLRAVTSDGGWGLRSQGFQRAEGAPWLCQVHAHTVLQLQANLSSLATLHICNFLTHWFLQYWGVLYKGKKKSVLWSVKKHYTRMKLCSTLIMSVRQTSVGFLSTISMFSVGVWCVWNVHCFFSVALKC